MARSGNSLVVAPWRICTLSVLSAPSIGTAGLLPACEMRIDAAFFKLWYAGSMSQPTTTSYLPLPMVRRSCASALPGRAISAMSTSAGPTAHNRLLCILAYSTTQRPETEPDLKTKATHYVQDYVTDSDVGGGSGGAKLTPWGADSEAIVNPAESGGSSNRSCHGSVGLIASASAAVADAPAPAPRDGPFDTPSTGVTSAICSWLMMRPPTRCEWLNRGCSRTESWMPSPVPLGVVTASRSNRRNATSVAGTERTWEIRPVSSNIRHGPCGPQ